MRDGVLLLSVDPEAIAYYGDSGDSFNVHLLEHEDSAEDYIRALSGSPTGNTADSIMDRADQFGLAALDSSWAAIADRGEERVVFIGFGDENVETALLHLSEEMSGYFP